MQELRCVVEFAQNYSYCSKVDLGPSLDSSVDLPKHNLDDIMNEGKTLNDKVKK